MADDRKPIKISPQIWEEIKDWQNAERKRTGVEPTQGKLLEEAWKAYAHTTNQVEPVGIAQTGPYVPANLELHDKLETILNSGDEMTIAAVVPNIEIFYARLKPVSARRKSGS